MHTLIQSAWGGEAAPLIKRSVPHNKKWAKRNGWRFVAIDAPHHAHRFPQILEALATVAPKEMVVSIDCDSIILRDCLLAALPDGYDVGLGQCGPKLHAGTLYLRNTPLAHDFILHCMLESAAFTSHMFPDFLTNVADYCEKDIGLKLRRLGPCWDMWNGATGESETEIVVRSLHRMPMASKIQAMDALLGGLN